jgi:hypothetical protein
LLSDVIKAGKGKVSDLAISWSTFYAQRKDVEEELATKLKEAFKNDSNVLYIIVHWDGKKVKLLDKSECNETLTAFDILLWLSLCCLI